VLSCAEGSLAELLERTIASLRAPVRRFTRTRPNAPLLSRHSQGRRPLSESEAARAERSLQLNTGEVGSLLASAAHAFSRAAAQGASSGALAERLAAAGASQPLAAAFAGAWKAHSPALLAALRAADFGSADRLLGVGWRVSLPVAGEGAGEGAAPVAVLELRVGSEGAERRLAFECSHEQLGALFDDLERINAQLDALG